MEVEMKDIVVALAYVAFLVWLVWIMYSGIVSTPREKAKILSGGENIGGCENKETVVSLSLFKPDISRSTINYLVPEVI